MEIKAWRGRSNTFPDGSFTARLSPPPPNSQLVNIGPTGQLSADVKVLQSSEVDVLV